MKATVVIVGVVCSVVAKGCAPHQSESPQFTEEQYNRYYEAKEAALERLLGPMHDIVGHAIVPFGVTRGNVDMFNFPNGIAGTGFATMELIEPDGRGPKPNRIGTYELVTFTKLEMPAARDNSLPFYKIERRMCQIMTTIGYYSYEAVLNPGETGEIPADGDDLGLCLIFDEYRNDGAGLEIDGRRHCLLLCTEVFRSEMEYAMHHGSEVVLSKLKDAGYYPYSDLDREPVF
ncbi:MAG: suppressor of fused domain protein [Sedimentisphaerales bacterium]|nr:suppressor of fused domain protein [Sedimentisphaerales bacterium]